MTSVPQKYIGIALVAFSLLLIILLVFVKANVDKEEAFLCETVHSSPELTTEQCPAHESNNSWLLLTAFGIAFVLFGSGVYLSLAGITVITKTLSTATIKKLDKEERQVYELLKQHDGSMYQSELIKETEFSKVKMTRVLDRLVSKQVVDRQRRGMTNIVVLK